MAILQFKQRTKILPGRGMDQGSGDSEGTEVLLIGGLCLLAVIVVVWVALEGEKK